MKILLNLFAGLSLMIFTQTCGETESGKAESTPKTEINQDMMEITGTIEKQGMTSYQYGTHTISTEDDEFYALKSEAVDLDNYVNKEVTIVAEKIDGYPVDGGPDYLMVLEVK